MSSENQAQCFHLPRKLWWTLTAIALGLIFALMSCIERPNIERDLSQEVNKALAAEGLSGASSSFEHEGRDATLTGTVGSETQFSLAEKVALGVPGVRTVLNGLDIVAPEPEPQPAQKPESTYQVAINGDKITLTGVVPSDADAASLASALKSQFPGATIDNELATGAAIASGGLISGSANAFNGLGNVKSVLINASASGVSLLGVANSEGAKQTAGETLAKGLGIEVDNRITVKPNIEPNVSATFDGSKITLAGTVSGEAAKQGLIDAAAGKVGAENVIDQLNIGDGVKSAGWLGSVGNWFGRLGGDATRLSVEGGTAVLTGEMPSTGVKNALRVKTRAALKDSGLTFDNRLTVKAPDPEPAIDCQAILTAAMSNQKIVFATNKATIDPSSLNLLNTVALAIKNCGDALNGKQVQVSGHTDDRGEATYNQRLSEQRAKKVTEYLVQQGIASDLLSPIGMGETQPISSNDTAEGRQANRRISFDLK